jgi:hypothetical protein
MASDIDGGWDDQDQSEVFDEDNQNADETGGPGNEMRTFEELPDVLDMTSAVGDADDDAALIAEELDDEEIIALESDAELADFEDGALDDDSLDVMDAEEVYLSEEARMDIRDEVDAVEGEDSEFSMSEGSADEVELEYAGDLENASVREGRRVAALEAARLDDDDLDDLGYPGEDEPAQHSPEAEAQRRR